MTPHRGLCLRMALPARSPRSKTGTSMLPTMMPRSSRSVGSWERASSLPKKASSPLTLHVRSDSQRTLEAKVTIRLQGLGVERDVDIAPFEMSPGQEIDIAVEPASFPIKPTGTSVTALARVDYEGQLGPIQMPAGDLRMAFSPDQQRVFVSSQDDAAVRLGSLGSLGHEVEGRSATLEDREALRLAHLRFDGERDGVPVHERVDSLSGASIADVLELPINDDLESAGGQAQRAGCTAMTNAPVCVSCAERGNTSGRCNCRSAVLRKFGHAHPSGGRKEAQCVGPTRHDGQRRRVGRKQSGRGRHHSRA